MQFRSLRSSAEFRDVIRNGARSGGQFAVVYMQPIRMLSTASEAELGLIVGKVVGNAVRRNRVRRRLREIVRHYDSKKCTNTSQSSPCSVTSRRVVIRALPTAAEARFDELDREISGRMLKLERRLGLVAQ